MRKFRGKLINKYAEEWFYGDLVTVKNEDGTMDYYIISEDYESKGNIIELGTCQSPKVETDTIGQSTGLKDKNGVEIYVGDIVRLFGDKEYIGIIEYNLASFRVNIGKISEYLGNIDIEEQFVEVIGNIYDNKELLEEE